MGKFIKFLIALILICMLIAIGYAYVNVEDVIEYRDSKLIEYNKENIDEDIIINEIITENIVENNIENEEVIIVNKIINENLENIVENNIN
jgi:hypothetical protein